MKINLLFLTFICLIQLVNAQENATTDNGRKVILNNDGTWKYANNTSETTISNEITTKIPECEEYDYGSIKITNNKDKAIRVYFYSGGLKILEPNKDYESSNNKNIPKKVFGKGKFGNIIPAGATINIDNVMSRQYLYEINILNTKISSSYVKVEQCKEAKIVIN